MPLMHLLYQGLALQRFRQRVLGLRPVRGFLPQCQQLLPLMAALLQQL